LKDYITKYTNVTEPCPPDYSLRGYGSENPYQQTVFWTLRKEKEDAFWSDITNTTGISKDNIVFKNLNLYGCTPSDTYQECLDEGQWMINVPQPHGYGKSDVANPKDIISQALSNIQGIGPQMEVIILQMRVRAYVGDASQLVDSLAMPVVMIAEAVDNMKQVVDVANKIDEEKRQAIIMAFLGALLFFIPVAGEVLGTISSLATIGRIIALLGAAGNAAMDIATIVTDKDNAPLAIFSLILAPLALTDVVAIAKAARARRTMTAIDIAKLGTTISKRMGTIDKITGVCVRK
jgi:hypothetical protein